MDMRRPLSALFIIITVAGGIDKPDYPRANLDYRYLTSDVVNTFTLTVDCGAQIGRFNNCDGHCYWEGLPDCNYRETKFYLTNSDNLSLVQRLEFNYTELLEKSNFNNRCPTVLIVHGLTESADVEWIIRMQDSFMWKYSCANVIRIGWEDRPDVNALDIARHSELVGRRIGFFCQMLVNVMDTSPDLLHLIGFSMGAIMSGYTGEYLGKRHDILLGRITALDPYGPGGCYMKQIAGGYMLNPSHAKYVDVLHSNGGFIFLVQLGCTEPLGHVDYYPNGGQLQPTCKDVPFNPLCSHYSAPAYFTSTILSEYCRFKSFPAPQGSNFNTFEQGKYFNCNGNNCGEMGFHSIETNGTGKQFLKTLGKPPYCGSQFLVTVTGDLRHVNFLIELSDGNNTTGEMKFSARNSQVVIGIYSPLDFSRGRIITATITSRVQQIMTLTVTNDRGQSKYNCNVDAGLRTRFQRHQITLNDNSR